MQLPSPCSLQKTATFAWSPRFIQGSPFYLVAGSVAGALDATFSSVSELEIYTLPSSSSSSSSLASSSILPFDFPSQERRVRDGQGGGGGVKADQENVEKEDPFFGSGAFQVPSSSSSTTKGTTGGSMDHKDGSSSSSSSSSSYAIEKVASITCKA
ncbi:hypothetical protein HMI55_002229, partial [Coelomomyces lativittatus]